VTHYYQFLSRDKGCAKGWACKRAPQNNNTYKVPSVLDTVKPDINNKTITVQNSNMSSSYKIEHRQAPKRSADSLWLVVCKILVCMLFEKNGELMKKE